VSKPIRFTNRMIGKTTFFLAALLSFPAVAEDKIFAYGDLLNDSAIPEIIKEIHPEIKLVYYFYSEDEKITFGVFSDDRKNRKLIVCLAPNLEIIATSNNVQVEPSTIFKKETIKTSGQVLLPSGGTQSDPTTSFDFPIGYWLSEPNEEPLKVRFVFPKVTQHEFTIEWKPGSTCEIRMNLGATEKVKD